jgi:hypothetical protein
VLEIVRANVLTRFNAIVGALCAVILITGETGAELGALTGRMPGRPAE